jgi:ectoine hydroxylase-related dioxygenase (phytanoyl-CoA dioxygenase family)
MIEARVGNHLGIGVGAQVKGLGRDHIQLRISRPGSLDINPPHRDAYLDVWKNVLNLWLPICGCTGQSSLPVIPGSHLFNEQDVFRTPGGGAVIDGNRYRVPGIADARAGMEMIRPNPATDEVLAFTPFLIHGAAFNRNTDSTRMALEFRLEIQGQCY